ncbi:hypothetical protein HA402_003524 [Bradysia odoriphaga]|nr:hypothetical protein HA402_003524 [Bradysia odoriphaga]
MNCVLITVLLISGLDIFCQAVGEFRCEYKSDQVFEGKVEQSLLGLKDLQFTHFEDCEDALKKGFTISGVYRIKPNASARPFPVWCDMNAGAEGGGWIVIQTRFDGLVDFERTWKEYRNGFGNVDSEHWLGNNFIRQITENYDYELKIDLTGFTAGEFTSVKYSPFQIGSEDEKYRLYVGTFSNGVIAVQNRLSSHNGSVFETKDSDKDVRPTNCADSTRGAWWYVSCYHSNLNGVYMSEGRSTAVMGPQKADNVIGIVWRESFGKSFYSLKRVEMKVRKIRK